jgi:hypothetical protein
MTRVRPPVRPLAPLLPLNSLPWERFEDFCEDFISKLPGVKECHRQGTAGSRQRGVDIFADMADGQRWAFQCKRWPKFTGTDTRKAIEKTTYVADRYFILVSCRISSNARDLCRKNRKWDIWDCQDISRKIREYDIPTAKRLVADYFGRVWRKDFLGLGAATSFSTSGEYFRPLLDPKRLYNHTWNLVGREDYLVQIQAFMHSDRRVAILVGRGGIGKTKLLHAFAQKVEGNQAAMRFVIDEMPLTPESADELPDSPSVIVVDNAHRREDLQILLSISLRRRESIKLILACRPEGIDHILSLLNQVGFDPGEILQFEELKELTRDEVKELAKQALGRNYAHLADQLARVSRDCPLITVIGGQLVAKRAVLVSMLQNDTAFRYTVLGRFHEVLIGRISNHLKRGLCRSLLNLISAASPIRLNDARFMQTVGKVLRLKQSELITALGVLESAGVLLRRGNTLRITPDVLSDYILEEACLTPSLQATGYATQVFQQFLEVSASQVLLNIAELDWRVRLQGAAKADLLSHIWQSISTMFEEASNTRRRAILAILEDVAYYQPQRMMELVELAMRNPATTPNEPYGTATHTDVLHELPELLRRISYTLEYLPRCCEILWQLGRDDDRPLNQNPRHAVRVLADLASYHPDKPIAFNISVLEAAERLLQAPDAHEHTYSPLDILDPFLAKVIHPTSLEGTKIVWYTIPVSRIRTRVIRDRVLQHLADCASSSRLKIAVRAVTSLENALSEPPRGTTPSDDQWVPEQLMILSVMENLVLSNRTDPAVQLSIHGAIRWHAKHSSSEQVKQRTQRLLRSVEDSYDLRLTKSLTLSSEWYDVDGNLQSFEKRMELWQNLVASVAHEFLSKHQSAQEGVETLNDRLREFRDSAIQSNPRSFLISVSEINPNYAADMCNMIIEAPESELAKELASLLKGVRMTTIVHAVELARKAVDTQNVVLCRSIADGYCWNDWAENPQEEEVELVRRLLGHVDVHVRTLAIRSIRNLGLRFPEVAIPLLLSVEIGGSEDLAREYCESFATERAINPDRLTRDELITSLKKLERVQDIGDYHISKFLSHACRRQASAVAELLLTRVELCDKMDLRFTPLPYIEFESPLDGFKEQPNYEALLRLVRDRSFDRSPRMQFWFPKLFKLMSEDFSPASLRVLNEWVESGDHQRILAAAGLISDADSSFVFANDQFIINLLERAYAEGQDCYRDVCRKLFMSLHSEARSGLAGEPAPLDISIRDQAKRIAERLPTGTPAHQFYLDVEQETKDWISFSLARDEELFE